VSRIEDVLRDALGDAPHPPTTQPPLRQLEQEIGRARRRRRSAVVLAVLAVVTVATVLPTVFLQSSSDKSVPVGPVPPGPGREPPALRDLGAVNPRAIAPDASVLYYLGDEAPTNPWFITRIDPATGKDSRLVQELPDPLSHLAVGLGRVWAFGGGDGAYSDLSRILVFDQATGRQIDKVTVHTPAAPYAVAFAQGSAWLTMSVLGEVWRLTPAPPGTPMRIEHIKVAGQPTDIVATESGYLWIRQSLKHSWVRLIPTRNGSGHLSAVVSWDGPMLSAAGGNQIWTREGSRLIALTPALLAQGISVAAGARLDLGEAPVAAAQTPDGLWAATANNIYWFTASSLRNGDPKPAYTISSKGAVLGLAAVGRGLVIHDSDGRLYYWDPRG
jgi:hypothetical protein